MARRAVELGVFTIAHNVVEAMVAASTGIAAGRWPLRILALPGPQISTSSTSPVTSCSEIL